MKKLLIAGVVLLALAHAASAGVPFENIPGNGKVIYAQNSDGTYSPAQLDAGGNVKVNSGNAGGSTLVLMTPLGYGQIAATSSAVGLSSVPTIGIPSGATLAVIEPEGNDARYRDDGTNPTTTSGMRLGDGARLAYTGDLTKIKLISQTGTAAYNVSFYK